MAGPFDSAGAFNTLSSGIGSLFSSAGSAAEASAYKQAAAYSQQNAEIAKQAEQIQVTQAQRAIYQTIGGQQAQYGAAGLAESGSAMDILKSSQQQGNLQMQMLHAQGQINQNAYMEQAAANTGMANAASAQSTGSGIMGALSIVGAFVGL
jgi:hypothetical protein